MEPKVAVVTGGASGMGKIYAARMAVAGIEVAILDMNEAGLRMMENEYELITAYKCDISDIDQVTEVICKVSS